MKRQICLLFLLLATLVLTPLNDPYYALANFEVDAVDYSNQASFWTPLAVAGDDSYLAYNRPYSADENKHEIYIAKRSSGGSWSYGCLKNNASSGCVVYTDDYGHNQPSVAVDGDGYIHVFTAMHNSSWRYFRSDSPNSVSGFTNRSSEMPDQVSYNTYPVLSRAPNGDVYLIIRGRPTSGGRGEGRMYRWNNSGNSWSKVATFAAQDGFAAYTYDLIVDSTGVVHVLYAWIQANSSAVHHKGSYIKYNPTTNQFSDAANTVLTVPLTSTANNVVFQPLEGTETMTGASGSSQGLQYGRIAFSNTANVPSIAYRYKDTDGGIFKIFRVRWVNNQWTREVVYAGPNDTFRAIEHTHDGTKGRVYFAKKNNGQNYLYVSERISSGGWTETSLLQGLAIQRISALMKSDGTDLLYLCTFPTDSGTTGSPGTLYYETRGR